MAEDKVKKFFEELSAAEKEYTPELVKSSSAAASPKIEIEREEPIEELFEDNEGQLAIDVYQTPNEIIIESTIAGVKEEDLDISITNESVTIRGKRQKETKIRDEDYFYQECYWGKFSRSIILPQEVDVDSAVASLKDGILTIRLPKFSKQKSKKLKVKFS